MLRTAFTDLVGCSVPIQLAPMGAAGSPELAAAVIDAGGMAMLATTLVPVPALRATIDAVKARADGPLGANVLMPFLDEAVVEAIAPHVQLVDFYHRPPKADLVELVHDAGALAGWQVGAVDEAKAAVDAGCDLLVVRGIEGGGRMWGDRSLWPLLDEVLDAVADDVPVLAAGGIGTGRGLAAALAMGAAGVRMGTRFLATDESTAHDVWKDAVIAAGAADTVLTDAFSTLWPNGPEPHRVLRSALEAAQRLDADVDVVADMPGFPLPRFAVVPPSRDTTGHVDAMALYAGESVYAVRGRERAGDVVRAIAADAEARLTRAGAGRTG